MSKNIEGMQDASLEIGRPVLTAELQDYVDRHPWPHVKAMRQFVAEQLLEVTEVEDENANAA